MKSILAFFSTWIGGSLGVYTGLWSADSLLWVFFPIMVLLSVYGLARATSGRVSRGKWRPRCARTGRFLSTDPSKWGLTKPRKLSHPPVRLEHALIRSTQPSPYSN